MDRATGDLQLIRLVRQYSFLYDTTSDNYKNIKLKETVWKKISGAVGLPVETSKTRWKSLRTSYLRHCKLIACRKKESTKCRKWPLADELTFLNPYLVPTDYVPGTPSREEPEPLSEDAMARVYGDPSGRLVTSPPVEAIVGIEEDEDDDVEEIIEHHPQDEEMTDAYAKGGGEANGGDSALLDAHSAATNGAAGAGADSVTSEGSYSPSSATTVAVAEPEPPRLEPRSTESLQRLERRSSRFGGGGSGATASAAFVNGMKRNSPHLRQSSPEDADALRHRDTTRDFFLYLADTVKTFPPFLQAQVKGKCFEAVNSAELTLVSRSAYNANQKFNWNA